MTSRQRSGPEFLIKSEFTDFQTRLNNDLQDYQKKGNYALLEDLSKYQPVGNYATVADLAKFQPVGNYATVADLSKYQPVGNYATVADLAKFQPVVGPMGPMGTMGPRGLTGIDGPRGPIGPIGTMGPRGLTGIDGLRGPMGPMGPMGTMGPMGLTGIGQPGAPGKDGQPGAPGKDGQPGAPGVFDSNKDIIINGRFLPRYIQSSFTDAVGNDIRSSNGTWNECKVICDGDSKCRGFNFAAANWPDNKGACVIKSNVVNKANNANVHLFTKNY